MLLILLRNHSAFDINKGLSIFHRGGFVIKYEYVLLSNDIF